MDSEVLVAGLWRAGWIDRPVATVRLEPLGGHGRVVRAHLSYDELCRRPDGRNPDSVVAKLTDDAPRELRIYALLADSRFAAAPRAVALPDGGEPVGLLTSDLHGDAGGADLDLHATRHAVERLAQLHAALWEDPRLDAFTGDEVAPVPHPGWSERIAQRYPDARGALVRAEALLPTSPRLDPRHPQTLVHGDPTGGNVLVGHHGAWLVDWKRAHRGVGVVDLALLLGGATDPAVRCHHEWALVLRYQAALSRAGVEGYPREDCWLQYRVARAEALRVAIASFDALGGPAHLVLRCAEAVLADAETAVAA